MKYPWNIYPNLWQNSDFITPQSLDHIHQCWSSNWSHYFTSSPLKNLFGIHEIQWNTQQLSLGLIVIESFKATFPNGQNINYNHQWKTFNGTNFTAKNSENIYTIQCNLDDYSNLFYNKTWVQLALVIGNNGFQQDNFVTMVTEVEDYLDHYVNTVATRYPIIQILPTNLIKDNNYIPLMRIGFTNGVYNMIDFQYPIIFIGKNTFIGKNLQKFLDDLYTKIIYIHKDNSNNNHKTQGFLSLLMGYYQMLKSNFYNDQLTPMDWYNQSNYLLGQLESYLDFSNKIYYYYHQDIWSTFQPIIQRIFYIIDNFYQIGSIGVFQWDGEKYSMDINFDWSKQEVYLDFQGPVPLQDLIQWIENSLMDSEDNINENLKNKTRGMDRNMIDNKINQDGKTWIRYKLINTITNNHKLWILNPINLDLEIKLIKK